MSTQKIVEFLGTPKAGKTTAAHRITHALRRDGITVEFCGESWGLSSRELTESDPERRNLLRAGAVLQFIALHRTDVLIIDRGLIDCAFWLNRAGSTREAESLQLLAGCLSVKRVVWLMGGKETVERINAFALDHRPGPWTSERAVDCLFSDYADFLGWKMERHIPDVRELAEDLGWRGANVCAGVAS